MDEEYRKHAKSKITNAKYLERKHAAKKINKSKNTRKESIHFYKSSIKHLLTFMLLPMPIMIWRLFILIKRNT